MKRTLSLLANAARSRLLACTVLWLGAGAAGAAQHPMDPLDENEIITAASVLLGAGAARPGAIFQGIDLAEPPKAQVLAFQPGDPIPRAATVFFRQDGQSFKTRVDLLAGTFTAPAEIPRHDGQLGLTIQEVSDFGYLLADPRVRAALGRRGITTPEALARVFVTPLTAGAFGLPEEKRRIVKAQLYFTEGAGINLYARPLEGLQVIADLDRQSVVNVLDSGVVPLPALTADFDEASVDASVGLRPELRPIRVLQPQGTNFTIDGGFVEWQKWRFHVRFERRSGTVISLASYDGRSVLYQGSLSEIFVPYQDPDANWFYRTYMDAGEFGLGLLTSPLVAGLDVPENAVLLDALIAAAIPDPTVPVVPLPLVDAVAVFERLTGNPLWRHFELFAGGAYEGRAEVELVVRTIAQVGNYDYLVDWIFTQRGSVRVEVGLTGIDAPKAVASATLEAPDAARDTAHGALVAPHLVATNHSHFFNFRLDLDVDGVANSFVLGELRERTAKHSPRKSVWVVDEERVDSERRVRTGKHEELWRVVNPSSFNELGYAVGYLIESHDTAEPLMKPADYRRAGFIGQPLWVTAHDPDERYAAGDTPNQHPGEPGLPQYVADDESLVARDLVAWLTLGHHHVTAAEDFPVLSTARLSFELRPSNFFSRNPGLDLRRAPFEVGP